MAQSKTSKTGGSKKTKTAKRGGGSRGRSDLTPASSDTSSGPSGTSTTEQVDSEKDQFLISKKGGSSSRGSVEAAGFTFDLLSKSLDLDPDIQVVKRLSPPGVVSALFNEPGAGEIIVARMSADKAKALQEHPVAQLIIEKDADLMLEMPEDLVLSRDPGTVAPATTGIVVTITVLGRNNVPIEGANVYLFGSVFPSQAITDKKGVAQLTLFGETMTSVRALYVKPRIDYWSLYIPKPLLNPAQNNIVSLVPFDQFPAMAKFPGEETLGWGHKAMNCDKLAPNLRGRGVKVAVVDSGAAITHQDIQDAVIGGFDTTTNSDTSWNQDEIAHGSHCIGVIAGRENGKGIRGIASEADVFAIKIFPGGKFSDLIDALDHCIEKQVDVINLSLGSDQQSELLEQRILQAKQLGIACIVAAGNSAGRVQFPASSSNVLAVAAIGKEGEFPETSYHSTTRLVGNGISIASGGYFSAKFSCFGDEIDVCAPGVAIVSSVPDNSYSAWDGTSMAAPHVSGLAALILAHHPDFKGKYKNRNESRVERLFQVIRDSCKQIDVGDVKRTGAGMPDALIALDLHSSEGKTRSKDYQRGKKPETKIKRSKKSDRLHTLDVSMERIANMVGHVETSVSKKSEEKRSGADFDMLSDRLNNLGLTALSSSSFRPLSDTLHRGAEKEKDDDKYNQLLDRLETLTRG